MATISSCAIIVSSFDGYSDAWLPFFTLFFKYWPECPYSIYLISNGKTYPDPRVRPIIIKEDAGWAGNLKYALTQVPDSHVLYMQEDYFLDRPAQAGRIESLFATMLAEGAAYLRLFPTPSPRVAWTKDPSLGLGVIGQKDPYRTSLQAGFWDKSVLDALLIPGESGIAFEEAGSVRSESVGKPFFSVQAGALFPYDQSAPLRYIATGIMKRKWNRSVIPLFRKEGIAADYSKREFESRANAAQRKLASLPLIGKPIKWLFRQYYRAKSLAKKLYEKVA